MQAEGSPDRRFLVEGFPRCSADLDEWGRCLGGCVRIGSGLYLSASTRVLRGRLRKHGGDPAAASTWASGLQDDVGRVLQRLSGAGLMRKVAAEGSVEEVWRGIQAALGPTVVFILGSPGAGKGTQCERIAETFGYTHLSTGDLLREECSRDPAIARDIAEGKLVSQTTVVALLRRKMEEHGWAGGRYIIDGFPRSLANLEEWNASIQGRACVKFCLNLECSQAIAEARLLEFGKTSGRSDDNPDTIRKRFHTWYHGSQPVLQRFKEEGLLKRVDAERGVEAVWADVQELFGPSVIFAVGGPGAGKGTQCTRISETFGYQHLSTGDLLRDELQRPSSPVKSVIEEHVREGRLVPDDLVLGLMQRAMEERGWEGGKYLIDGFPRSFDNWTAWNRVLGHKASVKQALFFDCSEALMESRLLQLEDKRCDDTQDAIRKRLEVFRDESLPVIRSFETQGILRRIDASRTKDEVWQDVKKLFGPSVIFILGSPGVGKRTQCARIAETFGYHPLRMQDLLDEEKRRRPTTPISAQPLAAVEHALAVLQRAMEEVGWEGGRYVIDGFPTTCEDLEGWSRTLAPRVSTKLALLLESEVPAAVPSARTPSPMKKGRMLLLKGLRNGEAGRILDNATEEDLADSPPKGSSKPKVSPQQTPTADSGAGNGAPLPALVRNFESQGLLRKVAADQDVEDVWRCVQEALHFDLDSQLQNYAVVLVKHKASNEQTDRFVQSFLASHDIAVIESGTMLASEVLSKGLFDKAFFQVMNYATTEKPDAVPVSSAGRERFRAIAGQDWAEAVAQGHVLSAASALPLLGHTELSLREVWDSGSVQLHRVDQYLNIAWIDGENGNGAWVINGYALQWRNAFAESAKSGGDTRVRWFCVEFPPSKVPWRRLAELMGATDPKEASPDSIRGQFYQHWRILGLEDVPDIFNNCVIASSGPLEGLREWMLWTGGALRDHPLARSLLSGGVPEAILEAWLQNPLVEDWRVGQDCFSGPLFACSERSDHATFRASALQHVATSSSGLRPCSMRVKSSQQGVQKRLAKTKSQAMPSKTTSQVMTLLHFNDVYNVEPRKKEPVGGIARFVTRMRELKAEAAARGEECMCIFSGDAFNPSLTSTVTKGKHMVPALNAVGIDVACYGNHDFDFGVDELMEMASASNFPWLISNVVDKTTGEGLANGRVTHMMDWCGRKIGLMGLVEREWLVTLHTVEPEDVVYEDFCQSGRRLARQLREEGAELVLAITHMRVPNDELLAEEVEEIDVILGGHDHHYDVKPVGPFGTYVLKSGTDFRDITELRLRFTGGPGPKAFEVLQSRHVEIDSTIAEDPEMKELASKCEKQVGDSMGEVLGHSAVDLDCRFSAIRTRETNVGNFIADVMRAGLKADMAMVNSGTLRADAVIEKGPIRVRDLLSILPMLDELCLLELSGSQVLSVLQNGVSQYPRLEGRFLQVSGVSFTFDAAKEPGQRLDVDSVQIAGEPLQAAHRYRVCTLNYLRQGKDGFDALKGAMCLADGEQAGILPTVVREHLLSISALNGATEKALAYRVKRANQIDRAQLVAVGDGPTPLQQLAIRPEVDGRIRCLNPAPEG